MVKRHPLITVLVVALVLTGLFFVLKPSAATSSTAKAATASKEKEKPKEEKKLPVEVAVAKTGSISSSIVTTASLEPEQQVTMLSETQGIVDKILVDEGGRVREGQVLAQLSNREKSVALQKATIRLENAKQELDRKQRSWDQKLISQSDYDKAKYDMDVAESERNTALVDLDRSTIRAPFAGIVTERFIEKGQNINPQSQLFTILDADPLEAKIYLPEKEILGLQDKQSAELTLNSQKEVVFTGQIKQINPAVDSKTGTVKVTIQITKAPAQVRPGSFVDVKLVTQRHDNALLVPKKALIDEAGSKYVFMINGNTASRRNIQIGFMDDQFAEVISGIKAGESVVIAGQGSLHDGSKTETVATR